MVGSDWLLEPVPTSTDSHGPADTIHTREGPAMQDESVTPEKQLDVASLWRLLNITRQLARPIELEAALSNVVEVARDVLAADRGTVFLYDQDRDELYLKVATAEEEIRFAADKGIAGECAQSRLCINVSDCYNDSRFNREIDQQTGYKTRCLLSVPLIGIDEELVGVLQVLNKQDDQVFGSIDEEIAMALGAQCAVTIQRANLIEEYREKERMERDLAIARDIQQGVFPDVMPSMNGYELAGWSQPAEETGGDIYDAIALDEHRVLILLGDATGHGIGPALCVTQVRSMCRMAARLQTGLEATMMHINDQLEADLSAGRFVTAFLGVLDARDNRIRYCAAGQAPLLYLKAGDDTVTLLNSTLMPLGIMPGLEVDNAESLQLEPGDLFVIMSDGIFEAHRGSELFGVERVCDFLLKHRELGAAELIGGLDGVLREFMDGTPQADDMTVVVVKRTAG